MAATNKSSATKPAAAPRKGKGAAADVSAVETAADGSKSINLDKLPLEKRVEVLLSMVQQRDAQNRALAKQRDDASNREAVAVAQVEVLTAKLKGVMEQNTKLRESIAAAGAPRQQRRAAAAEKAKAEERATKAAARGKGKAKPAAADAGVPA